MERTIKFRGKPLDNNKWHYGHYSDFNHNPHGLPKMSYWITIPVGGNTFQANPVTIGQFTEFYDKNEKEIYEDDILKVYMENGKYELRQVYWSQGAYWTKKVKTPRSHAEETQILSFYFTHNIKVEVIGNIHDNPELIKI